MRTLTREEVLSIIDLRKEGYTTDEIAKKLRVHPQTITKRIKKLRELGYDVYSRVGRPPTL